MRPPHEHLVVYRCARDAARRSHDLALTIPAFRRDLADQLVRASTSVPANIAEAAAEFSWKEKVRIYRLARREACECVALLDQVEHVTGITPATEELRMALHQAIRLISNTMWALERPQRPR